MEHVGTILMGLEGMRHGDDLPMRVEEIGMILYHAWVVVELIYEEEYAMEWSAELKGGVVWDECTSSGTPGVYYRYHEGERPRREGMGGRVRARPRSGGACVGMRGLLAFCKRQERDSL